MSELGESVAVGIVTADEKPKLEPCKHIFLHAFRGDRSHAFLDDFNAKREAGRQNAGPGPTPEECLMWAGHVGISFESESPIYGFNPNTGSEPSWQVLDNLTKTKSCYPGKVTDDTGIFSRAKQQGLTVLKLEFIYPESQYNRIHQRFQDEQSHTDLTYRFPNGTGDCNCATWPARIGIPIPEGSGHMKLYIEAMQKIESPQRMGDCEE